MATTGIEMTILRTELTNLRKWVQLLSYLGKGVKDRSSVSTEKDTSF
jgi:hypothetical protein